MATQTQLLFPMEATLPPHAEMVSAFLSRDTSYEGVFFTAVRTTGIFCRPSCPARKPKPENVEFFATARDALFSGYRPCKRCHPMEPFGAPPAWVADLLARVEADPARRWRDHDLRTLGIAPAQARRWFQAHHGMTFHAYARARRLGGALAQIRAQQPVTEAALAHGYESLSGFHEAFRQLLGRAPQQAKGGPLVVFHRILTPFGPMVAGATDDALCFLEFADRRLFERQVIRLQKLTKGAFVPGQNAITAQAEAELAAYFAGTLHSFSLPLYTPGTAFQQRVWDALQQVPYGTTTTYGDLAHTLGQPTAVRAVAQANGANRLALILPCHRIVGQGGQLTGYGGGLWRKQRLLEHEQRHAPHAHRAKPERPDPARAMHA